MEGIMKFSYIFSPQKKTIFKCKNKILSENFNFSMNLTYLLNNVIVKPTHILQDKKDSN